MRIFVFEFITGGGLRSQANPAGGAMLAEGRAMLEALTEDLSAIDGVDLNVTLDDRLDVKLPSTCTTQHVCDEVEEADAFSHLAAECDGTILIAPEFDGILLARAETVVASGGRLLSCPPSTIQIAADKQQTAELLTGSGVPVPTGIRWQGRWSNGREFSLPAVAKPIDGAGSQGVRFIQSPDDFAMLGAASCWRVEQFCPGTAASCAVLCGPGKQVILPPCFQHLEANGSFNYHGGSTIADDALSKRAHRLARSAVAALPDPLGYVGVDVVLGQSPDGRDDYVVDINPRLTTSYVGTRHVVKGNLAQAMVDVALGQPANVSWYDATVSFLADGTMVKGCAEATVSG